MMPCMACRLVASEKKARLSEDEIRVREQEALLFSKISPPPKASDGLAHLLEQRKAEYGDEAQEIKGDGGDEEQKEVEGGKGAETIDI